MKPGKANNPLPIAENGQPVIAVIESPRRGPKGFHFPVALAERFGKIGLSYHEIAEILGVSKRTVQREFNKGRKSEFVTAYKKAFAETKFDLRKRLLERTEVSDTALIFALKNFCGFSDRPKNDELRDGELTINIIQDGKPLKEPDWLKNK
jgi:transcriptional regulator with XRE-family HTH domain